METKVYPPVVVVDGNDVVTGSAMLAEVWQKGLYHRIAVVHVLDDTGRMLLQLRGPHVALYPNCWDEAAAGHVDEGFDYDQTAIKELAEETGIQNVQLEILGTNRTNRREQGKIINQFERVYIARVPHGTALKRQIDEVAQLRWFTPLERSTLVASQPNILTPGLLHNLRTYFPQF
jgi:isopentenyldiphosphate isomerase